MKEEKETNVERIELKEEYTYEEIKLMLAMVVGWFTATKIEFTEEDIEEHREYTATCCEELGAVIRGGCDPIAWEDEPDILFDDSDEGNNVRH